MDKEQQPRHRTEQKLCCYFWPGFQSCSARYWIHVRFSVYFKHIYFPFWGTNIFQAVFFELLQNIAVLFTSGLHEAFWLLLVVSLHCVATGHSQQRLAQGVSADLPVEMETDLVLVSFTVGFACFSRLALSFHFFFFKATSLVLVLFHTCQRWGIWFTSDSTM